MSQRELHTKLSEKIETDPAHSCYNNEFRQRLDERTKRPLLSQILSGGWSKDETEEDRIRREGGRPLPRSPTMRKLRSTPTSPASSSSSSRDAPLDRTPTAARTHLQYMFQDKVELKSEYHQRFSGSALEYRYED